MPYHIKKPSHLNSSVNVYYIGNQRLTDKYDDRKQYTNNPTYLTTNYEVKNGGWAGCTVVTE